MGKIFYTMSINTNNHTRSFLILFSALLFSACNNKKNDVVETTTVPDTSAYTHSIKKVVPNQSDIHFDKSLELFNEKKYKEASEEITNGKIALEKEANETVKKVMKNSKEVSRFLNFLATSVEKGEVKSADELESAFEKVSFTVAHDFFIETETYLSNDKYDSVVITMQKGDDYLSASSKYNRKPKNKIEELSSKAKLLNSKIKKGTKTFSKELKDDFKAFVLELKKIDGKLEGPVPESY
jgi:hypothetical protein